MDKSIGELIEATQINGADLFLLQQGGNAKKLVGQTLINWLLAQLDGHGGIHNIAKTGTAGLVDTYTITFADTSTSTFAVSNGKGVASFAKVSTSGVNMTWRMTYNDGTHTDVIIANGEKGDKGDNAYIHVRWAAVMPTASSHVMMDTPNDYIGIYSGNLSAAPADWTQYKWFKYKGEKGDTGDPARVVSTETVYQMSASGTVPPTGNWNMVLPIVPQGSFLWTRNTVEFNTGYPIVSYSVVRNGIDGKGSVSSVNLKSPDASGNVNLTASDVGARDNEWMPNAEEVHARADTWLPSLTELGAASAANVATYVRPNLLDNWYFANPVNQRGLSSYDGNQYSIDRWKTNYNTQLAVHDGVIAVDGSWDISQPLESPFPSGTYTLSAFIKTATTDGYIAFIDDSTNIGFAPFHAGDSNVVVSCTVTSDSIRKVALSNSGNDNGHTGYIAVKLERGPNQTLAHQENGVWVLNEIPDYGEQLARCQRYYYRSVCRCYSIYDQASNQHRLNVSFPVVMRAVPSLSIINSTDKTAISTMVQKDSMFLFCQSHTIELFEYELVADL